MERFLAMGFTRLQAEEWPLFQPYYDRLNGVYASSISFPSLIAWAVSIPVCHRQIGAYRCCVAKDPTSHHWVWLPPLGAYEPLEIHQCLEAMIGISDQLGMAFIMTDISEWMLPYLESHEAFPMIRSLDQGVSDYVYSMEAFVHASKKQDRRYAVQYFIRKRQPQVVAVGEVFPEDLIKFLSEERCQHSQCQECRYGCMVDTLKQALTFRILTGLEGIVVLSDDRIIGYSLVSREKTQLMFHLKMAIHGARGINEFLHKECVERFGEGALWINYTEDMNREGLRSYKQRLAPYTLWHRYELTLDNKARGEAP